VFGVAQAVGLEVGDAAIVEDCDAGAGDMSGLEQLVDGGVDLGCWDRSAVEGRDGSLRSGGGGGREEGRHAKEGAGLGAHLRGPVLNLHPGRDTEGWVGMFPDCAKDGRR